MSLVFDIETVGEDFDSLDEATKDNLTRWIKREALNEDGDRYKALLEDLKNGLGFSPLTGRIVALGVYDTDKHQGVVYFAAPDVEIREHREENFLFKPRTEKEMLEAFWSGLKSYREVVSFNGRSFDLPFLMIRSAVNGVRPTVDLMTRRYLDSSSGRIRHIDLLDQLSFYGAVRRKGSLHLYCRAFGIKSPKASGITGDEVAELFRAKKYQEIAEYNSWDLIATAELLKVWQEYFSFRIPA
jgi:uncharacterized protein YprB with RNaseH-like and TPR domain